MVVLAKLDVGCDEHFAWLKYSLVWLRTVITCDLAITCVLTILVISLSVLILIENRLLLLLSSAQDIATVCCNCFSGVTNLFIWLMHLELECGDAAWNAHSQPPWTSFTGQSLNVVSFVYSQGSLPRISLSEPVYREFCCQLVITLL